MINIDENKLLEDLKQYRDQKGYDGLFGLFAKLAPEKVDKNDLENYKNLTPSVTSDMMPMSTVHLDQFKDTPPITPPVMEASIYAEEHIPAVQQDLIEHGQVEVSNEQNQENAPKARVLELERKTPNPWGDAEVVAPGHLKL